MKRTMVVSGSMHKVNGVAIGDFFTNTHTGTVHKCMDIKLMEGKWSYGYFDEWLDQKQWVVARFVQPYTLLDVVLGS